MLKPELLERYQEVRSRYVQAPPGAPVCLSPITGLHFLPRGLVMPCCTNTSHVLGVYPRDSLADIWNGEPVRRLREALSRDDLSLGCQKCERQFNSGDFTGYCGWETDPYIEHLDRAAPEDFSIPKHRRPLELVRPSFPRTLGFELHNTCNLECVMCTGERSSRIRRRRMGESPIPNAYDRAFLDQLEPFLPYVQSVWFAGGEPFLTKINYDLWERIAGRFPQMEVMIITNGTVFNDRIRRLLERLNVSIQISVDSIHKPTYESIRVGASFEKVMENSRQLQQIVRSQGKKLMWRHCVMRKNWIELPDILRYCNENDIHLEFNQVDFPLGMSIQTLPPREIQMIVDYWRRAAPPPPETGAQDHTAVVFQHMLQPKPRRDAPLPSAVFNAGSFGTLAQRVEGFTRPQPRRDTADFLRSMGDRTENEEPGRKALPLAAEAEEVPFLNIVFRYMTDRILFDNERQCGGAGLPDGAEEEVADLREKIRAHILSGRDSSTLHEYVAGAVSAYMHFWATPEDHSPEVFKRGQILARLITQHPARVRILDALLAAHPGAVYKTLQSRDPAGLEAFLTENWGPARATVASLVQS